MSDTRSYTELPKRLRVRTLVDRRRLIRDDAGAWTGDSVLVPAGTEGTIVSCSHAGFRGRVHMIRTDEGHLVSEFSALQLEAVR